MRFLLAALLLPIAAWAQLPSPQPQTQNWFSELVEVELRMKKTDGTTAKLVKLKFDNLNARYFNYTAPCWNTASPCPEIASMTTKVFLKLPWSNRLNVTRYALCPGTECQMPAFSPLTMKPGEGISFRYDRVQAAWANVPDVVSMTAPPPPAADPAIPPLAEFTDAEGAKWTLVGTHPFRNGVDTNGSGVVLILYKASTVYAQQSGGEWWKWTGTWTGPIPAP